MAGNDNEQVRGTAGSVVLDCDPLRHILRSVVQKECPKCRTSKQIETNIAIVRKENTVALMTA
ncbi:hypothetical protein LMTR13_09310 [Bradyrhizobium icense]|uniref:Uncharacterized protein n=1 Tax=Bradyrhizobium icense TaxID=1274631 RepID=A0A1B1UC48_9BRAD|nr:hypothetical protein LMTR13_09310 [Bradyrhizobium icense]